VPELPAREDFGSRRLPSIGRIRRKSPRF